MFTAQVRLTVALCLSTPLTLLAQEGVQTCVSPDKQITFAVSTAKTQDGPSTLVFNLTYRDKNVLRESRLGIDPLNQAPIGPDVKVTSAKTGSGVEEYKLPHGKTSSVRHPYNSLLVDVAESTGLQRKLQIEVRVFDDGAAFRYVVPQQPALREAQLEGELTEFRFPIDAQSWPLHLAHFRTSYEDNYVNLPISGIKQDALVALPLLTQLPGTAWLAITEANLENYAGMYLVRAPSGFAMRAKLAPRADRPDVAVVGLTPLTTPWRVLQLAAEPAHLIHSNIVQSLNPPSTISDLSWIRPGKTSWTWWSGTIAKPVQPRGGMTTGLIKHYIDFSSSAGLEYVLIDEGWSTNNARGQGDLREIKPEIDLPAILEHARSKNVKVWLWAHWEAVDRHMEEVFAQFSKWGVAGVKIDFMDRDDQWMVEFYRRASEVAAKHKLMLDFHGAYKPTGATRTWPNVLTYEGVLGLEYLKWSGRATAAHNAVLPFTRMLAGPLDYTPGGFNNVPASAFMSRNTEPLVPHTRAHQLGLFVILESAFQMLADHPEAYAGQKELNFLKSVPAAWDETRGLAGFPGKYAVVARRKGDTWYLGAITNEDARELQIPLEFLPDGAFSAELYSDGADPKTSAVTKIDVTRAGKLNLKLSETGGAAVVLRPAAKR